MAHKGRMGRRILFITILVVAVIGLFYFGLIPFETEPGNPLGVQITDSTVQGKTVNIKYTFSNEHGAVDVTIDWGNGYVQEHAPSSTATFIYPNAGQFMIVVNGLAADGTRGSDSIVVTVG